MSKHHRTKRPRFHAAPAPLIDLNFDEGSVESPGKLPHNLDKVSDTSAVVRIGKARPPKRKPPLGRSAFYRRRCRAKQAQRPLPPPPMLGANSAPERQDKEIENLWQCDSINKVGLLVKKWNRKFRYKWRRAINRRVLDPQMRATIEALLATRTATSIPIMANAKVGKTACEQLHKRLVAAVTENPELEIALVTIISGDWATSHTKPFIDLHHSQAAMQSTLRALAPNYFGVTELALFNSYSHASGGQLVQGHGHILIWGEKILQRAQKVAALREARYAPNVTDAAPIDVRRVGARPLNIARVCAYLFKPPHRCKTWCPPHKHRTKGFMHEGEKGDRFLRFLRMAEFRSLLTFEDITFASGAGQAIRSDLYKLLRVTCEADAGPQRVIHPDAIASFWADVAKALGKGDWTVPIIARRK